MSPAFLELPLSAFSSSASRPLFSGLPPPILPPTILLMGAQICKLFNLINAREAGVTLCYLESLNFRSDLSLSFVG